MTLLKISFQPYFYEEEKKTNKKEVISIQARPELAKVLFCLTLQFHENSFNVILLQGDIIMQTELHLLFILPNPWHNRVTMGSLTVHRSTSQFQLLLVKNSQWGLCLSTDFNLMIKNINFSIHRGQNLQDFCFA